ncbi:MAG: hypothetical protein OEW87_07790 [Flavobacteriaceae bacterium]|nr:hypothetical protein [Flavobacteriaceae bacterium]
MRKYWDELSKSFIILMTVIITMIAWPIVFIFQAAIGLPESIFLIPIYLIPFCLFCIISFSWIIEFTNHNMSRRYKKSVMLTLTALSIIASLTFQYSIKDKLHFKMIFKHPMLAHMQLPNYHAPFGVRLATTLNQFNYLMSFSQQDKFAANYIENSIQEAAIIDFVQNYITTDKLQPLCNLYYIELGDYQECFNDMQTDLIGQFKFSATGNMLLLTMASSFIYELRPTLPRNNEQQLMYAKLKPINDIIEVGLVSIEQSLKNIEGQNTKLKYTYHLNPNSLVGLVDKEINIEFVNDIYIKVQEMINKTNQSIAKYQDKGSGTKREISSLAYNNVINKQIKRNNRLRAKFKEMQNNGVNISSLLQQSNDIEKMLLFKTKNKNETGYFKKLLSTGLVNILF